MRKTMTKGSTQMESGVVPVRDKLAHVEVVSTNALLSFGAAACHIELAMWLAALCHTEMVAAYHTEMAMRLAALWTAVSSATQFVLGRPIEAF
jgi:hypothetical protein